MLGSPGEGAWSWVWRRNFASSFAYEFLMMESGHRCGIQAGIWPSVGAQFARHAMYFGYSMA